MRLQITNSRVRSEKMLIWDGKTIGMLKQLFLSVREKVYIKNKTLKKTNCKKPTYLSPNKKPSNTKTHKQTKKPPNPKLHMLSHGLPEISY